MNFEQESYDIIVIGSGVGGMSFASVMAQMYGKKGLVLERHYQAGGFTHEFSRKRKYSWDTGVHYVGDMGPDGMGRKVMDYLTENRLDWAPMPDPYEMFVYPDFKFPVSANKAQYKVDLKNLFPAEAKAIDEYFEDVETAMGELGMLMMNEDLPRWVDPFVKFVGLLMGRKATKTVQEYLDKHFIDPKLKALLASQLGDYGLPGDEAAFGIHATIVSHYSGGGFYPVGGGRNITRFMEDPVRKMGGEIVTRCEVKEILIEDGKAAGVRAELKEGGCAREITLNAPVVVSDAGARTTFLKLLKDHSELPFIEELKRFPSGHSFVTLYLGLNESPESLGFRGENHWLFADYAQEAWEAKQIALLNGDPQFALVSFPSLKNPAAEAHTAEILHFADYDLFEKYGQDKRARLRDEDYQDLKQRMADGLLDFVERHYPGFKNLVEFAELSTPLSIQHFTGHEYGAPYGLPAIPERFKTDWLRPKTPIDGLYLTGADVGSLGIMGATMGGMLAAGAVGGGLHFPQVMSRLMQGKRHEDFPAGAPANV